jgi:hypothetical protein
MTTKQTGALIYATAFGDGMPDNMCGLIEAQSKHETDEYTSNAFRKNNNCFGYKTVKGGKWQAGAGIKSSEGDPYASYTSIENSVHELTDWIKRRMHEGRFPADLKTIKTPQEYALLLKQCGYFGDTVGHYVSGLQHFLNSTDV